jgi:hypothetical protein
MVMYSMDKYAQLRSQGIDPYANQSSNFVPLGEPEYTQLGPIKHLYQDPLARSIQASPVGQAIDTAKQVVVDAAGNIIGVVEGAVNQGSSNFKKAYNLQSGTGQVVVQPMTASVSPATPMQPTSGRTTSSIGYQNIAQPTDGMYMPTTATYGRTSPSFASQNQQITYAPGRSPIMDGNTTVGFTEVASDGSQKVYYVVAGYPKSGMPKPGTYKRGVAIPRARKMRYNKRKPRTTKSKKKIATSQKKMTKSWLGKKLRF